MNPKEQALIDRVATEAALSDAAGAPAPMSAPPLDLLLANSNIIVADGTFGDPPQKVKMLVIRHVSGGFQAIVPIPPAQARVVGDQLSGRPPILVPEGANLGAPSG